MMTYGETFRYFRQSKGLTLKQVADHVNSMSLIGQFETDQCHISVDRFVHLLEQIGVSYDEFQLKRQGTTRSAVQQQIHDYRQLTSIETVIAADGQHISEQTLMAQLDQLAADNQHQHNLQLAHMVQLETYYYAHADNTVPRGVALHLQGNPEAATYRDSAVRLTDTERKRRLDYLAQ